MSKIIHFDEQARYDLKKGADIMAEAMRTTYGPRGHHVVFDSPSLKQVDLVAPPKITRDGMTVAKEIKLKNRFVNMGAALIEEAAVNTGSEVGGGATTSAVIAHAIITEGIKSLAAGADAASLKRGIEKAAVCVMAELQNMTKPLSSKQQILDITTIAAHDADIGQIIVDTVEKVGRNGIVTIEAGHGLDIETEFVEGARIDRGYISPYFVNRPETQEAVIDQPHILITDKKISNLSDLLPALEMMTAISKNVVVICEDMDKEALATLVANKLKGTLSCLAIRAPGSGVYTREMLEDLAIVTGGQLISSDKGRGLDSATKNDLGRARRVVANKDNTTIYQGYGDPVAIQQRVETLVEQDKNAKYKWVTTQDYERKRLEERLSRLSGGIAIIRVGAPNELQLREKWRRLEGALEAAKAAAQQGMLPGGGVAFINAIPAVSRLSLRGDEQTGAHVVMRALEEPLRRLVENAGYNSNVVLDAIRPAGAGVGFDVLKEEYGDMEEKGIIDPSKVIQAAFRNAVSIANLILVTEALIADKVDAEPVPGGRPAVPGRTFKINKNNVSS